MAPSITSERNGYQNVPNGEAGNVLDYVGNRNRRSFIFQEEPVVMIQQKHQQNHQMPATLIKNPNNDHNGHQEEVDNVDNGGTLRDSPGEIRLSMKKEGDRLKTYNGWPCTFMDPKELAKNGFYYIHHEDIVRCAFCNVEIGRWENGDSASSDHQRWSVNCPFLRGVDVGNVPINSDDENIVIERASQDTCGRYGIEIRPNAVSERAEGCSTELSKLGVNQHKGPVYPKYSTKESRLRTFEEWPKSMRQNPDELSDAGFFYTGKGDQTICFSCGGGLKDWDQNDDPWEQHAKWFSKCLFVMMVKGRDFIQEIAHKSELILPTSQGTEIENEKPSTSKNTTQLKSEVMLLKKVELNNNNSNNSVKQISDGRLCKICYAEELGVVFLPCGHIVACVKCAPSLSTCAVCRQPFAATVRAFLS